MDFWMSDEKSAAISLGSAIRSTVPSRAVEISRSSSTCQRDPTPRASHWNFPVTLRTTCERFSRGSDSFLPSVSRIAWRWAAWGTVSKSWAASWSHVLIAVPPDGLIIAMARLASSRAAGSIWTIATRALG
ncbi:hypothetical protein D3C74_389960 [compost metagenome]